MRATLLQLSLLLLIGVPAFAGEPADDPPAAQSSTPAEADADAGPGDLRAWVDPETGELVSAPTPEQREAFERALRADLERQARTRPAPRAFQLPDGGTGVYVEGGFPISLVVHPTADGGFVFDCRDPLHSHAADSDGTQTADEDPDVGPTDTEPALR